MIPLSDSTPRRTVPLMNYLLIAANIVVFLLQLSAPSFEEFVISYGFIPASFSFANPGSYLTIFSSMFMHGGFFHIISNLWFLHIFGDNVEDEVGHISYLLFYLAGGVAATLAQYLIGPESDIPLIGASGAISAVAGAYLVRFAHSRIRALVPTFFGLYQTIELPVWFFLGYWFLIQTFSGIGSLVIYNANGGGVAWFAHLGGFLFGYFAIRRSAAS